MLKGEKIGLIPIGKNYMPGQAIPAIVQDVKNNNVVVCEMSLFTGIAKTTFIVEDYFDAMFVQLISSGNPAVIHLKKDSTIEELLSEEGLKPKFNRKTLRYEYAMPQSALDEWVRLGVLKKEQVDWHYACRDCDTMITVREGCYNCFAIRNKISKLIRHNKCGYIGFAEQFNDWNCPQCKEKITSMQGEFEIVQGPAKCRICGYLDTPTRIAGCLGCGKFFPLTEAKEMHVFKYQKAEPILIKNVSGTA